MHKPAQVELQLDWPQLPYSETLGPTIAGGSSARYRRRQPNPTKKGPHSDIRRNQMESFYNNITIIPLILKNIKNNQSTHTSLEPVVGAFSDRIGLPPAVTGWAASCDGGP